MDKRTRNVLVTPIVLLIRLPLMVALTGVIKLGELADRAQEWVDRHVAGWVR